MEEIAGLHKGRPLGTRDDDDLWVGDRAIIKALGETSKMLVALSREMLRQSTDVMEQSRSALRDAERAIGRSKSN